MFTRKLPIATTAAALLALASLSFAAEEAKDETHHMHVTIDHQVETAKTPADHEAIAKRFEDEATDLEKQAGEHERLAKRYHSGIGVGPKTNAASLATHCDNFVKNLRASANDAREMARLHRDMAKMMAR